MIINIIIVINNFRYGCWRYRQCKAGLRQVLRKTRTSKNVEIVISITNLVNINIIIFKFCEYVKIVIIFCIIYCIVRVAVLWVLFDAPPPAPPPVLSLLCVSRFNTWSRVCELSKICNEKIIVIIYEMTHLYLSSPLQSFHGSRLIPKYEYVCCVILYAGLT